MTIYDKSIIMKKMGIYFIRCIINNKLYIGSAFNIKYRWKRHFNDLKKNKHHSPHLQRAYNKYGENKFETNVLEEVLEPGKYRELIVTMHNSSRKAMMIYPGQVVASITVEVTAKKKVAAKKPYKTATFSTEATLVPEVNTIFSEG